MYTRQYKLQCMSEPKMDRFRIVATQGKTFEGLMNSYKSQIPKGFLGATDDYVDNTRWEITTKWESKQHWEEALKHPYRKMFWTRFELEAIKHDLSLVVIDGDTGEELRPLDDWN